MRGGDQDCPKGEKRKFFYKFYKEDGKFFN